MAGAVGPGDVLAGRYRLVRPVGEPSAGSGRVLWLADDDVLARPVAVSVLAASTAARRALVGPYLEAAGRAGVLAHPSLARVFDAAVEERPGPRGGRGGDVAYVVRQWVDGRPLREVLQDGPLDPDEAAALAISGAEALEAAHAGGVAHGRVHLGNALLVAGSGRPRLVLTDAGTAAAAERPGTAPSPEEDVRDLAAVLYALLTARWPGPPSAQPPHGLPAAPHKESFAVYSPRQVRAAVPRALDVVVVRALEPHRHTASPALTTPSGFASALERAAVPPAAAPAPEPPSTGPRPPSRAARVARRLAPAAVVVAVSAAAFLVGRSIGTLPADDSAIDALASPTASADGAPRLVDLGRPPVVVQDFDPGGEGGEEQPEQVPNTYDSDGSTAWTTDTYRTATFGGLKDGVGLLLDLKDPQVVDSVEIALATPGAHLELRGGDRVGDDERSLPVIARAARAGAVTRLDAGNRRVRFLLVWITRLPEDDGRFRAAISELRVLVR